ncbi:rhodanese-like domain-containing protein [Myceligenerans halotolerans]
MTTIISRDELAAAIEQQDLTLIDTLPAAYYDKQHLPGAVNLVLADVDAHAADLLPDKNARLVTYCTGPTCQNSTQVAARLRELGYTNVSKYADGIEDWTAAGLPTESSVPADSM